MTVLNGKNGKFVLDASDFINLSSWSITATSTFTEATPMDEEWTTKHRGFVSWSGTAETYFAGSGSDLYMTNGQAPGYFGAGSDIAHMNPIVGQFHLTNDPTDGYLEGKLFIAGVNPKSDSKDNNTLVWSFRGTSDLTTQA